MLLLLLLLLFPPLSSGTSVLLEAIALGSLFTCRLILYRLSSITLTDLVAVRLAGLILSEAPPSPPSHSLFNPLSPPLLLLLLLLLQIFTETDEVPATNPQGKKKNLFFSDSVPLAPSSSSISSSPVALVNSSLFLTISGNSSSASTSFNILASALAAASSSDFSKESFLVLFLVFMSFFMTEFLSPSSPKLFATALNRLLLLLLLLLFPPLVLSLLTDFGSFLDIWLTLYKLSSITATFL